MESRREDRVSREEMQMNGRNVIRVCGRAIALVFGLAAVMADAALKAGVAEPAARRCGV
jgi:hypothetical protein